MALWSLVKSSLYRSLALPLFCLYIHFGSVNYTLWGQYTIIYLHGLTNTGSLWVLHFQPHRFQGIKLDWFHIQTTV